MKNQDKLSDQVVNDLLQRIIKQDYSPGTFLPSERELQSEYSVSRPVIREALHKLSAIGVISSAPRKGAVVNADTTKPLLDAMLLAFLRSDVYVNDVLPVRLLIETHVASLAAEKASDEQIRNLQYLCAKSEEIDIDRFRENHELDWDNWREIDTQFHVELARSSQNPVLVLLVEVLKGIVWNQIALPGDKIDAKQLSDAINEHCQITQMVAERDAEAAQQAMSNHLMSSFVNHVDHQRIQIVVSDK